MTFEVAKLKEPDKFGRTFTCYNSRKVNVANEPAPEKPKSKKKAKKKEGNQNFPF